MTVEVPERVSRKDISIGRIIDNAIDYIPKREQQVYDPDEGMKDAIRTLKAIYEARLSDYVDSKQESVIFCYELARFLQDFYPRKKRKKKRVVSQEVKDGATKRMRLQWSPNGKLWNNKDKKWQAEAIKLYDDGGSRAEWMKDPDVRAAVEAYKGNNKTSSRKADPKK